MSITKGPWTRTAPQKANIVSRGMFVDESDGNHVAFVFGEHSDELQTNARAIAEVPAMIEAMREMLRVNWDPSGPKSGNIVTGADQVAAGANARAILKRIEG